jgi:hypothetical protein
MKLLLQSTIACVLYKVAQSNDKPQQAHPLAQGYDVKVPIVGLNGIEDYLYKHDHLLTFTFQPNTKSEEFMKD